MGALFGLDATQGLSAVPLGLEWGSPIPAGEEGIQDSFELASTPTTHRQYERGFVQLEGRSTVFLGMRVHNGKEGKPRVIARGTTQEMEQISTYDLLRGFSEVFDALAKDGTRWIIQGGGVHVFSMDFQRIIMGPIPLELYLQKGLEGLEQPALVSWYQSSAFAALFPDEDFSLPIGKEWEVAAGELRDERYSRVEVLREVAHFLEKGSPISTTIDVKSKRPNKYGLYNMLGNVWEWMANKYEENAENREVRGGSLVNYPEDVRVMARGVLDPGFWYTVGFRLRRSHYAQVISLFPPPTSAVG